MIARTLNIDYVDRQIIAGVAERLCRPSVSIMEKEMPPSTLLGRIAEAMAQTAGWGEGVSACIFSPLCDIPLNDKHYLSGLEYVIRELAQSQSLVIRGRGSQFILKDFPGAFHVLIVAPLEERVKRVMESMGIGDEEARQEIAHFDEGSGEFVKRYFRANITDPIHYDMVLNTKRLGIEEAASLIVDALRLSRA
jgi:hypothetical protein